MEWIQSLLSRNKRNSLIASETDVGEELEQVETQPEKRQRIMDEQSMVVYGQQQGSSSNSQLTSQSVALYNNSLIASESDAGKDLEQADTQPENRQGIMDEQSIVVYGQQQGSSSNSQLTSQSVTLFENSPVHQRIVILAEKLNHLFAQRADVLTELEIAKIQPGKKQREVVQHWLTEVDRKEHKLQTMIKDGQGSTSNSNISLHIESFIKEVDELIQRGKFPGGLVLSDQESTKLPLLLGTKPVGTSFQQNAEIILEWLQNHEHCIIGVYGMGGVGKTTLLMHIHDQLLQDSNPWHVYWVTVSQNCPVHKLQDDIAKVLKLGSFKVDDERQRAAILHNRLAARGRTVLILDDMWEQVSGSQVGIPLENTNCKIILSTRLYDVCRKMGCKDFVIKAEILHEGEAWDLFVEKLGHYNKLEEEAKKMAWEIAKECGGLPLAIATMARSLTDLVDLNEWKTALNDLKSARHHDDLEQNVFRILRYSYNRLNDMTVQNCFLSCILYHEDERIKRTALIDLWINNGLFDETESRDLQVAKGHAILNKLERSCLLESTLSYEKERCVKVHDLIRDMGIIITREHPLFIAEAGKKLKQVPQEEKWSKDLAKVSLSHNEIVEIPSGMAPMTPNLTVLMLNGNPLKEIPDSFFVHMKALTVVDLSDTEIEKVPVSVSNLENLRALILADCGNLIYVPSVTKLTKLRTLDLDHCRNLKEAPGGLERLKHVEEVSYIPWDVSNVIGFNEVIQSLTSLSRYRFLICDFALSETFDEWENFGEYEKVVWIRGGEFGEDKSICLVPTTLESLIIYECDMKGRSLGDVFQSPGEATGVKYIYIEDCRGLKNISVASGTQQGSSVLCTSQLEVLELKALPDIRSIARLGVPNSFSRLRELCISGCPKLKVVLPMMRSNQLQLPNLESVEVKECEELEEIFESSKAILSEVRVDLPKLANLKLLSLPKLKVVFPFSEQLHLPSLSRIHMEECEELEEIFGSNKAIQSSPMLSLSLPSLEYLHAENLRKIKVIFPSTEELHLPNLGEMWVSCCQEVEEIFETNEANPFLKLPKSKGFFLHDLPKLGTIYRGLLLCTTLAIPPEPILCCPKLKLWRLPGCVTSTETCSVMISLFMSSFNQPACLPQSVDNANDHTTQ